VYKQFRYETVHSKFQLSLQKLSKKTAQNATPSIQASYCQCAAISRPQTALYLGAQWEGEVQALRDAVRVVIADHAAAEAITGRSGGDQRTDGICNANGCTGGAALAPLLDQRAATLRYLWRELLFEPPEGAKDISMWLRRARVTRTAASWRPPSLSAAGSYQQH
jgi:hypothetical protein